MTLEAVVLAAGEGRRMLPLTERWPKPVLPVDGTPVLATLVRELAGAGCSRVVVVTGHLAEQVEDLVGDGSGFGVPVRTVRQPAVLGSADALVRALAVGARPPLLVAAADTRFATGDVRAFADAYAAAGTAGAMSGRYDPPPDPPHRFALGVVDGLVVTPLDRNPANGLSAAPLWGFGPELVPFLDRLAGPPFELAEAYSSAIADGLSIAGVTIGPTRDLTDPVDLVRENFPYLTR